ELEAKLNEAEKLRSEVIKLDEEHPPSCPLCGSPLKGEQLKKHLQNLSDEMVKYRSLLKSLLTKKKELSAKIENFEKRRAKKHRLESQLQLYMSELHSFPNLEKKLEECHAEAERLKKRIEESRLSLLNVTNTTSLEDAERAVEEAVKIAEEMKSLPSKRELKNKIDKEIKELEKKLGNLPQLTSKLKELHKRIEEKEEELRVVESTLQNLLQTLGNLQNRKSSLEKELSEIMALKEEAERLKKSLEELKLDHEAYRLLYSKVFHPGGLPTYLLSEVVNLMEKYVNRYLRLFGVDVKMKFKLNISGNQQRIDILTYSGGYQRRIETFSGGEQTLMGLAVRLSIGRLLAEVYSTRQRPQFLIIDEGFGPLDRDLRERVVDALKKLYEAGEYSQIVVISHHEDVKNHPAFRTIIRTSKDADGRSHVTIL
ncbi:MAG TPA: SMC family ATPase, partial [Candidatus Bathyarchaeota archaeon]|nr:SMC family ATPase [Candidatus Bathyarchaeota archaeon]